MVFVKKIKEFLHCQIDQIDQMMLKGNAWNLLSLQNQKRKQECRVCCCPGGPRCRHSITPAQTSLAKGQPNKRWSISSLWFQQRRQMLGPWNHPPLKISQVKTLLCNTSQQKHTSLDGITHLHATWNQFLLSKSRGVYGSLLYPSLTLGLSFSRRSSTWNIAFPLPCNFRANKSNSVPPISSRKVLSQNTFTWISSGLVSSGMTCCPGVLSW